MMHTCKTPLNMIIGIFFLKYELILYIFNNDTTFVKMWKIWVDGKELSK